MNEQATPVPMGQDTLPSGGKAAGRGVVVSILSGEGTTREPTGLSQSQGASLMRAVARDRDRTAFATLFRYYAPRIKSYMKRLGASDMAADELAQEAMLTVWRKADRFDPAKASVSTWIFRVARNLRIDALRREKHPEGGEDDLAAVVDSAPLPDEALAARHRDRKVQEAVAALPGPQAQVVRLSFYEGKPHSTIAAELGLPLGTVKSRLRLAFGRLRETMESHYNGAQP